MSHQARRQPKDGEALSTAQLLAFGSPMITHALIASPLYAILPTYYAANTAVTLAQIGTIAAFSRIIDAVNDPIMGHLSDRTRSRFGSRKPWVVAAILFCAISVPFLFSPPGDATWLYFLIWSQVLYTGFTMFEVPRAAWASEISRKYDERGRIAMYVGGFTIAGSLAFYAIPILSGFFTGNGEINAGTMQVVVFAYAVMIPILIMLSVWLVPQGMHVEHRKVLIRDVWRTITRSAPARLFYSATVLWGLGQGALVGCSFIFYTEYMDMAEQFPIVMAVFFITEIVSLPLWSKILPKYDRHQVWGLCVASAAVLGPLILFLPRGPEALLPVLGFVVVRGILTAPVNFLPGAVLGDVIDYDILKSGSNKAGNMFAIQMVLIKIAMAIGGAVAFNFLDFVDYDVGGANSDAAQTGLLVAYFGIPALFHLAMITIAWRFPIARRQQQIIQKRLVQRRLRLADPSEL